VRLGDEPYQRMGIEQDHFSASQSASAIIGDSMSPTISSLSRRHPKTSGVVSLIGRSFTSGFPFLVTITGSRVVETLSIIRRHLALNSPAATVFEEDLLTIVIY
jgi:hypothetical protein